MPLLLFFTTRNFLLSFLLIYVNESVEAVLMLVTLIEAENTYNSLISDVGIGGLSIFAAWLVSEGTESDKTFLEHASFWRRWGCFLVVGLLFTGLGTLCKSQTKNRRYNTIGIAGGACVYIITVVLFYYPLFDNFRIRRDVVMLLIGATFVAFVSELQFRALSTFWLVVIADGILVVAAFITFLALK